jgi:hypothetical protein
VSYERVIKQISELQRQKEEHVLGGLIKDFESYRFFVGEIKGLRDAIEICENNFKGENLNERI